MKCKTRHITNSGKAAEMIDRITEKAFEKRIPLNIHYELTSECNMNCIHCYVVKSEKKKELEYEEVKDLLDQLAEAGGLYLDLTGGEVLTRKDFFEIAEYARKKQFILTILTSGTLITESVADRIVELYPLNVEMSLYGATPKVHDSITRVPGSFEKVLRAVELLKERNVAIVLKTLLMKPNFRELEELFYLGNKLGVHDHVFDMHVTPMEDGSFEPLKYQLDEESLYQFIDGDIPGKAEFPGERPYEEVLTTEICSPATIGVAVSSFGDIYPCPALYMPMGNIREKSFKEIWYSDSPVLSEVLSTKCFLDLPECKNCSLVPQCTRCHGLAHLFTGDMKGIDQSACTHAKIMKEITETAKRKGG